MNRLKVVRLLSMVQELFQLGLPILLVLVAHGVGANVEGQTDGLRRVLHVAAALHDVLWGDIEGCRAVLLLEAAAEISLVIVLPLD